jgi:diguanylate cyclase (GGDEF)-like protein/putative nucleotidyltransferase with HDIG domain
MIGLPPRARVFSGVVIIAGIAVFVMCLPYARLDQPVLLAGLLVISALSASLTESLPRATTESTMSVAFAVDFAALVLLGPHQAMVVAMGGVLSQLGLDTADRTPLHRSLFNAAALVITIQAAGLTIDLAGGAAPSLSIYELARPLVGAAAVYFMLNTGFAATEIALSKGAPVVDTWRINYLWSAPSYFVGAGAAAIAASLMAHAGYWILPLMYAPLHVTYRTYRVYLGRIEDEQRHLRQISETADLHLATIQALAGAIDAKDQTTHMHIRRVQAYATKLAQAVGLPDPAIQGVRTAALLHDIGKLAVPEHILAKPGPLTQEEFQKIRIHPQVGAEIISEVHFPYAVAPLILCHHERWDGKGYPQGLAGESIPIGARILTIVDYYDAVTTDRPYHKALSRENAVALLEAEAGRALDPSLVPVFVNLLPSLINLVAPDEPKRALAEPASRAGLGSTSAGLVPASSANAFANIALAHREIYALYEIAQAMGTSLGISDTMALISSKLSKIVPWSGCALFLQQADTKSLKCRFATGIDAPRLLNAEIRVANDLAAWVARNGHTLINGQPGVTFQAAGVDASTVLQAAIVCPLQYNDAFIGCLALYHVEANHYTDDHRRLLERVAEQAGAVLHNSIVFEQTQEDSLTDQLTGLPNRRSMFVHLASELARAERQNSEVAVIVIDIDGLKAINDTYGHNVGDHALRAVATTLQGALRPYDLCVRYAGDEFIIVVSGCSEADAEAKRRELQQQIHHIEIDVRGARVRLGASAGVAVFPDNGRTYDALLAAADHRMYRDKAERRGAGVTRRSPVPSEFLASDAFESEEPVPVASH